MATDLIIKICGGEVSKFTLAGSINQKNKIIDLDLEKFKKVIGVSISSKEVSKILKSLGCNIKIGKKSYKIQVPSWRPDITEDIDTTRRWR